MNYMYINDDGDWACQYCCTSALLYESVSHHPDCPVILEHEKIEGKVLCPYCGGSNLDLDGDSGGGCTHCFNGYLPEGF